MNQRTFRVNANFVYEYNRELTDMDNVDDVLEADWKFFEGDPDSLHKEYIPVHRDINIEDITDTTTPELEENNDIADMEPRIERAIRDWWSNHVEQMKLNTRIRELETEKSKLIAEAETLSSRINEFTIGYNRHLMLNVYEDYFVVLVWNAEFDSHTIMAMRNKFGGGS